MIVVSGSGDDDVAFYITDDRAQVLPGQVLTYRLVISNPHEEDLTELRVAAQIPPYLIPIATLPEAVLNSGARTITWNNPVISADSEVTLAFKARVAPNVPVDYDLLVSADVSGPGLRLSSADETKVLTPGGVASIQTASASVSKPAVAGVKTSLSVAPTARTGGVQALLAAISAAALTGAAVARKGVVHYLNN